MDTRRILIVEDEAAIRDMLSFSLNRAGFEVIQASDCGKAKVLLTDEAIDLAIVDWMLPDMSGLELVRAIRRAEGTQNLPVIMLTARAQERDKISGLDSGADDYITKPFSSRELISRINALMRRSNVEEENKQLSRGQLVLDAVGHRVSIGELAVKLGPTEFRLLKFLMEHPERVYSRAQLLDQVWGANVYVEERTVDVHIRRLRKALEGHDEVEFIQTVRGAGYRFSDRLS